MMESNGTASYHALQIKARKAIGRVRLTAFYTYSKSLSSEQMDGASTSGGAQDANNLALVVPETQEPLTRGTVKLDVERTTANVIDAAATGAADGLRLALNVGAMLLAFIALIALVNAPIQWFGGHAWSDGGTSVNAWLSASAGRPVELSLQTLFGWILAPLAWLIGVPWHDANLVGSFIGEKVVINEFVAYVDMSRHLDQLSQQSQLIATYALCGFANFSSIAIQIGGIGGLAPTVAPTLRASVFARCSADR